MIKTPVRIWAEISRPARSMSSSASRSEQSIVCAISFGLKDSSAFSGKAIRGSTVMAATFLTLEASSSKAFGSSFALRRPGSARMASSVAAT